MDVRVEAVVALSGKGGVTLAQRRDRLPGVLVQFCFGCDTILRWILAVVALIVERRGIALIVWRNDTSAQDGPLSCMMVDSRDRVGLRQILRRVANVVDHAQIRLKDSIFVLVVRFELELVTERRPARRNIASGRDVDFIQHIVVKVVFVRSDARLFVRINAQRCHQHFDAVFLLHEGVNVRGVGRRIARDERRVHVAGGEGRRSQQRRQHRSHGAMQYCYFALHR